MVEEPTQDLEVPSEAIREEEQEDSENEEDHDVHGDHENEKEQANTVLFTSKQLEVLLKMNRPDFMEFVVALKGGSSKNVGFKLAEPGNFDEIQDQKVVDAWLADMEDYIQGFLVLAQCAVTAGNCDLS
jgi:hypothetical protein